MKVLVTVVFEVRNGVCPAPRVKAIAAWKFEDLSEFVQEFLQDAAKVGEIKRQTITKL